MCRGCSPGLQGEEDPNNLSDRHNPDYDPDNQDISDEPDESWTDEESDYINDSRNIMYSVRLVFVLLKFYYMFLWNSNKL